MPQYIWSVENVISDELCEEACRFTDKYQKYSDRSHYGRGENTNCRNLVLFEECAHEDSDYRAAHLALLAKIRSALANVVSTVIEPAIKPLMAPIFSPIQLRKMYGPTRSHFDNVSPSIVEKDGTQVFAARIVTFIVTLSETTDEIVFPRQGKTVPLKKGSVVLFPPYWMFEHYTTTSSQDGGRYSLTTWLNETSAPMSMESISFREPAPRAFDATLEAQTEVFRVPSHLISGWWSDAAPELLGTKKSRDGFDKFVSQFKNFASTRHLPLSPDLSYDVHARAPGEKPVPFGELRCVVNLGDEPTSITTERGRITLETGDGCWVPQGTQLVPDGTELKKDLDVLLLISPRAAEPVS